MNKLVQIVPFEGRVLALDSDGHLYVGTNKSYDFLLDFSWRLIPTPTEATR